MNQKETKELIDQFKQLSNELEIKEKELEEVKKRWQEVGLKLLELHYQYENKNKCQDQKNSI